MSTSHDLIHPALRSTVNALCPSPLQVALSAVLRPAPLDPTAGPLPPEKSVTVDLTYRGLIESLAELPAARDWISSDDLPELTLEQLGAVLEHYPASLVEAIAEYDPVCTQFTRDYLRDATLSENQRLARIGSMLANAVRKYVGSIVLRDVQTQIENNRIADALERQSSRAGVFTADELIALNLGVAKLFS